MTVVRGIIIDNEYDVSWMGNSNLANETVRVELIKRHESSLRDICVCIYITATCVVGADCTLASCHT